MGEVIKGRSWFYLTLDTSVIEEDAMICERFTVHIPVHRGEVMIFDCGRGDGDVVIKDKTTEVVQLARKEIDRTCPYS